MSIIKLTGNGAYEHSVEKNHATEYLKRTLTEHKTKTTLDHPDGSVTEAKLSPQLQKTISDHSRKLASHTNTLDEHSTGINTLEAQTETLLQTKADKSRLEQFEGTVSDLQILTGTHETDIVRLDAEKADKSDVPTRTETYMLISEVIGLVQECDRKNADIELVEDLDRKKADKTDTYTKTEVDEKIFASGNSTVADLTYIPESSNAQSGIAVAEAFSAHEEAVAEYTLAMSNIVQGPREDYIVTLPDMSAMGYLKNAFITVHNHFVDVKHDIASLKSAKEWELIGETSVTDADIAEGKINALTIGNANKFILDGVNDLMIDIYVPISSNTADANDYNSDDGTVRIGFANYKSQALATGNSNYEIVRTDKTTIAPIRKSYNNYIKIFVKFKSKKPCYAYVLSATNGTSGSLSNVVGVSRINTEPTTDSGHYLVFNSGLGITSDKSFNFPANSKMTVYARRNSNETEN